MDFEGKVALVTGGASGIGLAAARMFAERGAGVLIADRDASAASRAAEAIAGAAAVACDVTDPGQVESAVSTAVERFGGLDIMVNNAGMAHLPMPLTAASADQFEEILRVNVVSVLNGITSATPRLAERGGGVIISTASVAGLRGVALMALYAASKAAVVSLTQSAALELRPLGIRVNCVCPGNVDTPMLHSLTPSFAELSPVSVENLTELKQGRMGQPDDIAGAILALASPDSGFVSGIALPVDNAMSASLW